MKLDTLLAAKGRSDVISRASWYDTTRRLQPKLQRGGTDWVRQKTTDTETTYEPYELTDDDRLADDWIIVQGNEPPA